MMKFKNGIILSRKRIKSVLYKLKKNVVLTKIETVRADLIIINISNIMMYDHDIKLLIRFSKKKDFNFDY